MKLSELNTDRGIDVMCEIAPMLGNIVADSKLMDTLKRKTELGDNPTVAEVQAAGLAKLVELVPIVLKDHKADLFGILAAVNDVPIGEYSNQPLFETIKQIKDLLTDKAIMDFLS